MSLHVFWNFLIGLAAKYDFGSQTEGLVYDIFVRNMSNNQVHEKLFKAPKDNTAVAFQFAILFEDGTKRQKTYGHISQDTKIKEEPICSVSGSSQNNRECWRSGAGNFSLDYLKLSKRPNAMCNYCGIKGHSERACNQKKECSHQSVRFKANGNRELSGRRNQ